MYKRLASIKLLLLFCSAAASASPANNIVQSFDRERTQKLNFEPTQIESPDTVRSGGDPKNPPLTPAEIETTKKEIKRLRGLIESGQQMLSEAEGNQSAQIKIIGTLTLLEIEIRKLTEKLRGSAPAAADGAQPAQDRSTPPTSQVPSDATPANIEPDSNTKRGE